MIYRGIDSIDKKHIPEQIYQLKITIKNIKPPIWRRLLISNHCTFQALHEAIQDCFYWEDYHLHDFRFCPPNNPQGVFHIQSKEPDGSFPDDSVYVDFLEDEVQLCDVFSENLKKVTYLYDFGDRWEHEITLENTFSGKDDFRSFLCVGGKRATPPEDCGGPWAYQDLLEILKNPRHREYKTMKQWVGKEFDPEIIKAPMVRMTLKEIKDKFGSDKKQIK